MAMVSVGGGDRMDWFVAGSRKGFLETGRGGGSSKGEAGLVGREAGEAARLRKGLFDERLMVRPADRWSKSRLELAAATCMRMTTVIGT